MSENIMDYFPLATPRDKQVAALSAIQRVMDSKATSNIILESPVGAGKSAMALAITRYLGTGHIITTQKHLQNQYFEDFSEHLVTMKGRNSYPCIHEDYTGNYADEVRIKIRTGNYQDEVLMSCSDGKCLNCVTAMDHKAVMDRCIDIFGGTGCPYLMAADIAEASEVTVHNVHSFFYQTNFASKFSPRKSIVVDEAHDLDMVIRDILSESLKLPWAEEKDMFEDMPLQTLVKYLSGRLNLYSSMISMDNYADPLEKERRLASYREFLSNMMTRAAENSDCLVYAEHRSQSTTIMVKALDVRDRISTFLNTMGCHRLLMSGTLFNKQFVCDSMGLNPEETIFVRGTSEFPVENRPVIYNKSVNADCSMGSWYKEAGVNKIVQSIKTLMDRHPNEKGLIHVGSYQEAEILGEALQNTGRVITHNPNDYQQVMEMFYASRAAVVLISPRSQQGVDMRDDRARFQIITKVPYLNIGDRVIQKMKSRSRLWYNLKTLTVFCQQLGRIVRSPTDHGVTYLLDSRFPRFLSSMWKYIPEWQQQAIQFL